VTANDVTRVLNAPNPAFTAMYSGFRSGEGPQVLTAPVLFETAAASTSPVGTYPVTPRGATAANYSITFVPGTLTVTNNGCMLFDATRPVKSGSTVPIKLALCDAAGLNVSAPSTVVSSQGLTLVSTGADGPVQDAGHANPDANFRYDAGLEGYIFNLQTKALAAGTYRSNVRASGDPVGHAVQVSVR